VAGPLPRVRGGSGPAAVAAAPESPWRHPRVVVGSRQAEGRPRQPAMAGVPFWPGAKTWGLWRVGAHRRPTIDNPPRRPRLTRPGADPRRTVAGWSTSTAHHRQPAKAATPDPPRGGPPQGRDGSEHISRGLSPTRHRRAAPPGTRVPGSWRVGARRGAPVGKPATSPPRRAGPRLRAGTTHGHRWAVRRNVRRPAATAPSRPGRGASDCPANRGGTHPAGFLQPATRQRRPPRHPLPVAASFPRAQRAARPSTSRHGECRCTRAGKNSPRAISEPQPFQRRNRNPPAPAAG
jgi:hypothetical protein